MHKISKKEHSTSVVFLGIDSVSRINLERSMPETYSFLRKNAFLSLNGYTKIADNTLPNLAAILTGRNLGQLHQYCGANRHVFNNCELIWDRFKKQRYITAYGEDYVRLNTFQLNGGGFSKPPTDIYLIPYLRASEQLSSLYRNITGYCSGPETSGERIMNVAKDFITTFRGYPKFGFFFTATFSHDDINFPSIMDGKVADFLESAYKNLDNNTILILFSDHGSRGGKFRYSTAAGWLEERLPFFFVHFPENFIRNHPSEYRNFQLNTERLTNPFDIYMTLQDILRLDNTSYQVTPSPACPKCHSLFQEVNENRTCREASIYRHWCLCSVLGYISNDSPIVQEAAKFIIFKVNEIIKNDAYASKYCSLYNLKQIFWSRKSYLYVNEDGNHIYHLVVMLETTPFATFEATVGVPAEEPFKPLFELLGSISRTNVYKKYTMCFRKSSLRNYCYCKGPIYRFFQSFL